MASDFSNLRRVMHTIWMLLVFLIAGSTTGLAQCAVNSVTASISSVVLPNYNPLAAAQIRTSVLSIRNNSGTTCNLSVSFFNGTDPARMLNGVSFLAYNIENVGNTKTIIYLGGTPANADRININNIGAGATATRDIDFSALTGQTKPGGTYVDNVVRADIFNRSGGGTLTLIRSVNLTVSTTVPSVCTMGTPSPATIAFGASDIVNGLPPTSPTAKTTSISASCNAPATLRLTGQALQPLLATLPRPGFDNFINYQATAAFGAANTTLTTTTTSATQSSASLSSAAGTTLTGTVNVGVVLQRGNPIVAGNYSGILTVTLEPTP